MSTIIACSQLGRFYGSGAHKQWVLQDVDVELNSGEVLTVMGRSGSGKSTLLHCLAGLEPFDTGQVFWDGQDIKDYCVSDKRRCYRFDMGFVYQQHYLLLDLTALDNVLLPLEPLGLSVAEMVERAQAMLVQMGLDKQVHQPVHALSGGQRQRVALARALVHSPRWVFLDEPTASLDAGNRNRMLDLIQKHAQAFGTAFMMASHDEVVASASSRVMRLGSLLDKEM